jgi:hypothetical protein
MSKNAATIVERILIAALLVLPLACRESRRGPAVNAPPPSGAQAGPDNKDPTDNELVAMARKHVQDSAAWNDEYVKFVQKHAARNILDPTKSGNGVEVTPAYREVTFVHNGWPYDGPRLMVVVRVKPDGSLISIHTRAIPALGP